MCIFQVINSIDSNGGYSTVLFGILIQGQNTSHNHFSKESTTLSKNTKKANTTPLHAFHCFVTFHSMSLTWLPPQNHLVHMWHIRQSSSDRSYIAGISNYSNIHNFHGTTRSFMLKKAMVGTSNLDKHIDNCRPIIIDILKSLVQVLSSVCCSIYEATLLKAIFTKAFYGYFRIEKLLGWDLITDIGHPVQLQDITFSN